MNLLELYKAHERNIDPFLHGVKEMHSLAENLSEPYDNAQRVGRISTVFAYGISTVLLVNYLGPLGFLILYIPAKDNFKSWMRHRDKLRRLREIGED